MSVPSFNLSWGENYVPARTLVRFRSNWNDRFLKLFKIFPVQTYFFVVRRETMPSYLTVVLINGKGSERKGKSQWEETKKGKAMGSNKNKGKVRVRAKCKKREKEE